MAGVIAIGSGDEVGGVKIEGISIAGQVPPNSVLNSKTSLTC